MAIGLKDASSLANLSEPGTTLIVPVDAAGESINHAGVAAINPRVTLLATGAESAGAIQTLRDGRCYARIVMGR